MGLKLESSLLPGVELELTIPRHRQRDEKRRDEGSVRRMAGGGEEHTNRWLIDIWRLMSAALAWEAGTTSPQPWMRVLVG